RQAAHRSTGPPHPARRTARRRVRRVVSGRDHGRNRRADAVVRIRELRAPRPFGGDIGQRRKDVRRPPRSLRSRLPPRGGDQITLPLVRGRRRRRRRGGRSRTATEQANENNMKITGLKTFVLGSGWRNLILLRLETDQPGLYGIGEATVQWGDEGMLGY